jgi:hypothetical protein
VGDVVEVKMATTEHSPEQGQRVHYLANLGGLVVIAGLEDLEPDLLLGALLLVASQLVRPDARRDARLRRAGSAALDARAAAKRAFAAHQRAKDLHPVYLTSHQCRGLIRELGGGRVEDPALLVRALMVLVRELG